MAELQRSAASFRRQGSSGLVWEDKFLSRELMKPGDDVEIEGDHSRGTPDVVLTKLDRSRSNGEGGRRYCRTMRESLMGDPDGRKTPPSSEKKNYRS
ncbi:hypothetical protein MLD38_005277 [Melastoma candidum]|uniref:Uncharacterized protein n=1 Tax=Melastoma candidum TaxID=119954 RepID=A0ACB9S8R3_9MYRT|nr:hypothetical protein MLD38_005277 [Melastoma candidum]